jgi:hypothetical protein
MQGMAIEVNVERLTNTLRSNRDKHADDYRAAREGWKTLLKEELETKLATLRDGGEVKMHIENQPPDDHTADYDEAIEMLMMSAVPTIKLDQQTYRQFIKDDWSWKRHWAASNTAYITAASVNA